MSFYRFFGYMSKAWVLALMTLLIVVLFMFVDKPLALYLHHLDLRQVKVLFLLTQLGFGVLYFAGLLFLTFFFRYIRPNAIYEARALFLWLCALIPSLLTLVVKMCFGRARPDVLFDLGGYGFYWLQTNAKYWSFPSGHTTTTMGFCFGMWAVFPRYRYLWVMFGLTIALSRVLLTQHYLSDVVMASYLTLLTVGLMMWALKQKKYLMTAFN